MDAIQTSSVTTIGGQGVPRRSERQPSVVLVAPPNASMTDPRIAPPLGLLSLVGWARSKGWDTSSWRVIDLNVDCFGPWPAKGHWTHDFSLDRCMSLIPAGADIYGLSLASMQLPHGRAVAGALRVRDPNAVLICGGSHASAVPEECAVEDEADAKNGFDYVVALEGEIAFVERRAPTKCSRRWRKARRSK